MINKNLEVDFFYQHLPPGHKRSLDAFINSSDGKAVTYREASSSLGISVNTLKSNLRRIRRNDPDTYYFAMNSVRKVQLQVRHQEALARADEHSHQYHINMMKHDNFIMKMVMGGLKRQRKLTRKQQAIKDLRDRGLGSDYLYDTEYSDYKD